MNDASWTKKIKDRDNNICRRCGIDKNPEAHHILPKKKFPKLRHSLWNGITLCGNCHSLITGKETDTYLRGFLSNDTQIYKQLITLFRLAVGYRIKVSPRTKRILIGDEASYKQAAKDDYQRAKYYMEQKEYREALRYFDIAIRHQSDYFQAYQKRGQAKYALRYYTAAIYDFDKALSLRPDNANLYLWRGLAKRYINNYQGAITDFEMLIKLASNPEVMALGYQYKGDIKTCMEKYEAAILDYDKSIKHKNENARAYLNRGRAKLKIEQYQEAVDDFYTALGIEQPDADTAENYKLLADAYIGAGYRDAALASLNDAIELKGDDPTLYVYRAEIYETLQQYEDAILNYEHAIRLKPNNRDAEIACAQLKQSLL